MTKKPKQVYRIVDNDDPRAPFALVEPNGGTIVQIGATPGELSAFAFAKFGEAIEVKHEYDGVAYAERFR